MQEYTFKYLEKTFYGISLSILAYYLPWYISLLALTPLTLKIYSRLTVGWCRSLKRMDGQTVIITGANTGIGLETAKDLARRGGKIILACRNIERGRAAMDEIWRKTGNQNIYLKPLDLTSLASIRKFANQVVAEEKRLDVLVNNAGTTTLHKVLTADNLETNFQANHFGSFLLTNLLLDLMRKTGKARIVMISSAGHKYAKSIELDNLNSEKHWSASSVYPRSKLATVLMTKELHRRLQDHGYTDISVNALNPGAVRTSIMKNMNEVWFYRIMSAIFQFFGKSAIEGAQTSIHLAVCEEVDGISGEYFSDCKKAEPHKLADDVTTAKALWELSAKVVGLKPSETIV